MNEKEFDNLIEDYLEGKLDPDTRLSFEKAMGENTQLAESFEQHQFALEAIDLLVEEDLKNKLKDLQKERAQKERFQRKPFRLMAVAATFLILVMALGYVLIRQNYSNDNLYASAYQAVEAGDIRGSGDTANQLSVALSLFDAGKWQEAYDALNAFTPDSQAFAEAAYYKAHSLLELGRPKEAAQVFQALESTDLRFGEASQWYLALALLKADEIERCKTVLESIVAASDHSYAAKAENLKKKLDSFWR